MSAEPIPVMDVPAGSVVYGVTWDWWKMKHIILWRDPDGQMQATPVDVHAHK